MYSLTITTPRAGDPLTAAELREFLRLNDSAEDALLAELVTAAADRFELDARRPVLATTYRQHFARWPCGPLVLGRAGVTAVTAVAALDQAGAATAIAAGSGYTADLYTPPPRVHLAAVPAVGSAAAYSPVGYVDFTAGWADTAAVPKAVRVAVRQLAAHWYEHREAYRDSAFELRELQLGWAGVVRQFAHGVTGDWGQ